MIKIQGKSEWITESELQTTFNESERLSRPILFDKRITGNGGTTAFLNLKVPNNECYILTVPNVAVAKEKENAYQENPYRWGDNEYRFIYADAIDKSLGLSQSGQLPNFIVIVADSLMRFKDTLQGFNVTRLLNDENHTTIYQSSFRPILVGYTQQVQRMFPNASIVNMTATPTLLSEVDVQYIPPIIKGYTITEQQDRELSKKQMVDAYLSGEKVVCYTNNVGVIQSFKKAINKSNPILKARFVVGDSLMRSIVGLFPIQYDEDSNLTIVSSRGFEGIDINYTDAIQYFFEDRSYGFDTHFAANLVQAFGRCRKGAKTYNYVRLQRERKRPDVFKKGIDTEINNFLNSNRSPEKMLSKNILKKANNPESNKVKNIYLPYIHFTQDEDGKVTVEPRQENIDIYKELRVGDKPFPQKEYESFFNDRNIIIKTDESMTNRVRSIRRNLKLISKNLYENRETLKKDDLFGAKYRLAIKDYSQEPSVKVSTKYGGDGLNHKKIRIKYYEHLQHWLAHKNYDNEYEFLPRQNKALEVLNPADTSLFDTLIEEMISLHVEHRKDKRTIESSSNDVADADSIKSFTKNATAILGQLCLMMSREYITVPSNWTLNRDYNLTTKVSFRVIKHVCNYFGVDVTEVDIPTCNPRILYAKCGLNLPNDFYGENKKNKTKINILLNNFMYNESLSTAKKTQKGNAMHQFKYYNFNPVVIDYLMDNYFEVKRNFRGQLSSDLAFIEKHVISIAMKEMDSSLNDGIIRRHDSFILFNNKESLRKLTNISIDKFPNIRGWFPKSDEQNWEDFLVKWEGVKAIFRDEILAVEETEDSTEIENEGTFKAFDDTEELDWYIPMTLEESLKHISSLN